MLPGAPAYESRFFLAPDGLRLHVRDYQPAGGAADAVPLVCLPGLARTGGDFDRLARALSGAGARRPRRVLALDYRGRGLSDRDRDPRHYDLFVENADVSSVLVAAGVTEAVFLGTSRGGLHIFLLALLRPRLLRGAILNDIGPVIEAAGLARVRAYVGKLPRPASWEDAVAIFRRIAGPSFSSLTDADWLELARLTFEERQGVFVTQYDPALARSLDSLDLEAPLPVLWPQFEALRSVPLLAIRGANSDLLSPATLAEMARRHRDCETYTVAGQGHAPLLLDEASIARITAFVDRVAEKRVEA